MLTHFDENGKAIMVDVTDKNETKRIAIASGKIYTSKDVIQKIKLGEVSKGDVLGVARIAGIMASKKTSDLIPMCHPLFITGAKIDFVINEDNVEVISEVSTKGQTGVEMEALFATTTALLTIYDMCKAMDKGMVLTEVKLNKKLGGKSGVYINDK